MLLLFGLYALAARSVLLIVPPMLIFFSVLAFIEMKRTKIYIYKIVEEGRHILIEYLDGTQEKERRISVDHIQLRHFDRGRGLFSYWAPGYTLILEERKVIFKVYDEYSMIDFDSLPFEHVTYNK